MEFGGEGTAGSERESKTNIRSFVHLGRCVFVRVFVPVVVWQLYLTRQSSCWRETRGSVAVLLP